MPDEITTTATPAPAAIDLTIDVDKITIDAFLEMMEIQERIQATPKAADIKALFNLLSEAVIGVDVSTLPYRYLNVIMQRVTQEFSLGVDPN